MSYAANIFKREPVAVISVIELVILAVVAFGVNITPEQIAAIMAPLIAVGGLISRNTVTPTVKVADALRAAPIGEQTKTNLADRLLGSRSRL